jgi:hypothetical protein
MKYFVCTGERHGDIVVHEGHIHGALQRQSPADRAVDPPDVYRKLRTNYYEKAEKMGSMTRRYMRTVSEDCMAGIRAK